MSLEEVIENIPQIIIYFVPGYIFLGVFCFLSAKKIKEIETLFVRCVVISYVLLALSHLICTLTKLNSNNEIYIALALSVIIAFISVKIYSSDFYKKILGKTVNISGHNSIWEDLFDRQKGSMIRGYVKYRNHDVEIKGTVKYYEILEDGICNIALWNYTITCSDFNVIAKEDHSRLFYIKSCDIEGLEVFQGKK